jgi:sporulation protein YlmC with PRC-barrel domain
MATVLAPFALAAALAQTGESETTGPNMPPPAEVESAPAPAVEGDLPAMEGSAPATAEDTPAPAETVPAEEGEMTAEEQATEEPAAPPPPAEAVIPEQSGEQLLADNLIGKTIYSGTGDAVGEVEDILFDKDGEIQGIVLSVGGGFLGLGAKEIAIAWEEVVVQPGADAVVEVAYTEEQLVQAPEFKTQEQLAAEEAAKRAQEQMESQPGNAPPPMPAEPTQ